MQLIRREVRRRRPLGLVATFATMLPASPAAQPNRPRPRWSDPCEQRFDVPNPTQVRPTCPAVTLSFACADTSRHVCEYQKRCVRCATVTGKGLERGPERRLARHDESSKAQSVRKPHEHCLSIPPGPGGLCGRPSPDGHAPGMWSPSPSHAQRTPSQHWSRESLADPLRQLGSRWLPAKRPARRIRALCSIWDEAYRLPPGSRTVARRDQPA